MKNLFILGNPRSGTSLLRLILNCHGEISVPPECGFIQWWSQKYGKWSIENSYKSIDISNFVEDIKSSKKIETWGLDFHKLKVLIAQIKPKDYASLCNLVIYQYGLQINKEPRILGDKNNYYLDHLDLLDEMFPNAYYIAIIRDGRDVACSYLELNKLSIDSPYKPKLSNSIKDIAIEWDKNNKNLIDFCSNHRNDLRTIIRFEDLVKNMESTLRGLCKFLKVTYDPLMTEYHLQNNNNLVEPDATLGWKKKTREAPDKSKVGRYQIELSIEEVQIFNDLAKDSLKKFNYF